MIEQIIRQKTRYLEDLASDKHLLDYVATQANGALSNSEELIRRWVRELGEEALR